MPRKITGPLPGTGRVWAYGLQADEAVAPFKVAVLALVVYLLTTIPFVLWWLHHHPGDLQNAFIPTFYIAALMGTMMSVPGIFGSLV